MYPVFRHHLIYHDLDFFYIFIGKYSCAIAFMVLTIQFQRYYEVQPDVNPPVKLDPCIVIQGDQPYVVEPLVMNALISVLFMYLIL